MRCCHLKQLEFVSDEDLAAGLVMVFKGAVSNQMNINKETLSLRYVPLTM